MHNLLQGRLAGRSQFGWRRSHLNISTLVAISITTHYGGSLQIAPGYCSQQQKTLLQEATPLSGCWLSARCDRLLPTQCVGSLPIAPGYCSHQQHHSLRRLFAECTRRLLAAALDLAAIKCNITQRDGLLPIALGCCLQRQHTCCNQQQSAPACASMHRVPAWRGETLGG